MAFYIPYIAGSVSFAYVSNKLYSYMYDEDEPCDAIDIVDVTEATKVPVDSSVIGDTIINEVYDRDSIINEVYDRDSITTEVYDRDSITTEVYDRDSILPIEEPQPHPLPPTEPEYKCHICNKQYTLINFSKNQQKKQHFLWKCKICTKKMD
jgi:hypothetical protein